jgi:hypothetical protein
MDGPDLSIPVRISDLIWTVRSRSDGAEGKGKEDLTAARVLAISIEVAARCGRQRRIWWPLVMVRGSTRLRRTRQTRWRRRRPRFLPGEGEDGGWRRYGGGVLRVQECLLDLEKN